MPADAVGVELNITSIQNEGRGFATLYPCTATRPTASTLNYTPGINIANATTVAINTSGEVCIYTSTTSHYALDVVAHITPATSDTFEDQFDGELRDGWQWRNENPELWSLNDTPGWLTIVAADPTQNVLVREVSDDALEVQTAVRFSPTSNFQFAGVFVGTDESSFLQLGRGYCDFCIDDAVYMDNIDNAQLINSSSAELPKNAEVIHLRLVVDDELVSGYVSDDAERWTLVGEGTRPGTGTEVGLIAGQAQLETAVANFDYFALSPVSANALQHR